MPNERCEVCAHWMRRAFDSVSAPCGVKGGVSDWDYPACPHFERKPPAEDDPARVVLALPGGGLARILRPCAGAEERRRKTERLVASLRECLRNRHPFGTEMCPGARVTRGRHDLTMLNVQECLGMLTET